MAASTKKKITKKGSTKKKATAPKNNKIISHDDFSNIKPKSKEDIINDSIQRMKRLEEIHNARKNDEMISDKIAFWIFLLLALITNFFLSFLLIFLIVFLNDPLLYVIIITIGIAFGMVYSYLIHNLRYALFHHHAFAKIFILLTGAINVFYIISTSTVILKFINANYSITNIIGISLTYFISYLIPYFIQLWIEKFLRSE